jgi:hypothetical protein
LVELESGPVELSLHGVAEDFEFGCLVNLAQNAIDLLHHHILNKVFAAVPALQDRQALNDYDGVVANLERQIRNEVL